MAVVVSGSQLETSPFRRTRFKTRLFTKEAPVSCPSAFSELPSLLAWCEVITLKVDWVWEAGFNAGHSR